ncbi:glycosyltransferase family 4 protein [Paraburkholderia sediminicola]|uniref:Glycosyltransferase family 4 protein n=1 Tax=Paraburkholderia rhynchosiae TaxID=487049 RepID=A0ACC7N437_9BURK
MAHIVFVIGNLSDYHIPRYRALVSLVERAGHQITLVEIFGRSIYSHPQPARPLQFSDTSKALTLFAGTRSAGSTRVVWRIHNVVNELRPDIVITLGYHTEYSIYLCLRKLITGKFPLMYMSDSKADDGDRSRTKEAFKRLLVRWFDGALVAGQRHRDYALSLGIPLQRSRCGFDVIDVRFFSDAAAACRQNDAALRSELGLPDRYVLCVSRLVERKNVAGVVRAFARSGLAAQGYSLVIVGNGPYKARVEEAIRQADLFSKVVMVENVHNEVMPAFYALGDFLVLASRYDQWGLCANEAMAAGLPLIVTKGCGCAGEIVIDFENGFVVSEGSEDELSERMRMLGSDRQMRQQFGIRSREIIDQWTPELFAKSALELTEILLSPGSSAVKAPSP